MKSVFVIDNRGTKIQLSTTAHKHNSQETGNSHIIQQSQNQLSRLPRLLELDH